LRDLGLQILEETRLIGLLHPMFPPCWATHPQKDRGVACQYGSIARDDQGAVEKETHSPKSVADLLRDVIVSRDLLEINLSEVAPTIKGKRKVFCRGMDLLCF